MPVTEVYRHQDRHIQYLEWEGGRGRQGEIDWSENCFKFNWLSSAFGFSIMTLFKRSRMLWLLNSLNHVNVVYIVLTKTNNTTKLAIQWYNLRQLLYQMCSPSKCEFIMDNVKFIFTRRTELVQKFPQTITLD